MPLREQLARKLAEIEIAATPAHVMTTSGCTQAVTLIADHCRKPGDVVRTEGGYRKHCQRVHTKLGAVREPAFRHFEKLGFLGWFDTGVDSHVLAAHEYHHQRRPGHAEVAGENPEPNAWPTGS